MKNGNLPHMKYGLTMFSYIKRHINQKWYCTLVIVHVYTHFVCHVVTFHEYLINLCLLKKFAISSEHLRRLTGVKSNLTSAYHPQSNGHKERSNQTLYLLLKFVDTEHDDCMGSVY